MAHEPRRGRQENGGSSDWDELMKAMLRPTPPSSRCRMSLTSGPRKQQKCNSKKMKCKERRSCEPKFEFLLCSVFRNVFGCSKEDSSVKIIAKKLKCLEAKVNDIERKCCTGRIPNTPPASPPRSPPKSVPLSPPKTPPKPATPEKTTQPPPPPPPKQAAKTRSEASIVSSDSDDEYEIKGLKVRKSGEPTKKEGDQTLKTIHVTPESEDRHKKEGRRNSPRYSLDVYRRRPSEISGGPSEFSNPDSKGGQRRITQFFQEQPTYVDRSPEIDPSSSSSIPSYIVETETEQIYVSHGTGQKKLVNLHHIQKNALKGYKARPTSYFFPVSSSGTYICDLPAVEESTAMPIINNSHKEKSLKNESVFNRVIKNENTRPVCFASPVSTSSESTKFERVCVVKSNSIPVIGRKLRHKKS